MKYVIISDLHVKTAKKYDRLIEGLPESIYWPLYNLKQAAYYAKENDAILVIAGDINDSKRLVSQQVITETLNTLNEVSSIVETYLLLGNHDYELYNGKIYTYLLNLQNVTVVTPNDPLVLNNELGLVAYNYDRERLLEDIRNIDPLELKGIVSHFGLQEGKLSGSEYRTGEFSLSRDFFELDNWLILGHYHQPQEIKPKVHYVGSPVPIKIDEAFEDKRFVMLDLDTDTLVSIPTTYPKYKKETYKHKDTIDIESIIDEIVSNDYMIKYILEVEKGHEDLKQIKDKLKEFQSNIILRILPLEQIELQSSSDIELETFSTKDLIDTYLQVLNIPNKDSYKSVFQEAMEYEIHN